MTIQPTQLISPNGLAILDALFAIDEKQLIDVPNATQFADKMQLYQPRLSQLMKPLESRRLFGLKSHIRELPQDWWLDSFRSRKNRRYLTLFREVAKPYHATENVSPDDSLSSEFFGNLTIGPMHLATQSGLLRDINFYYWGTHFGLNQLKRKYRLIPGEGGRRPTWYLATPRRPIEKEAILGNGVLRIHHHNRFRALFDLYNYNDSRIDEILQRLTQKVLKNEI